VSNGSAEGGSLGWGGGELGLQIGLPFCCLLGSQMQFIDNMRGTERGEKGCRLVCNVTKPIIDATAKITLAFRSRLDF